MFLTRMFCLFFLLLIVGCSASTGLVKPASVSVSELSDEGYYLWEQGQPEAAVAKFEEALAQNDTPELRLAIGQALLEADNYPRAYSYLRPLLEVYPANIALRESFAVVLLKQGDLAAAEKQFIAVYNHDSERPITLNYLGVLKDLGGDHRAAEPLYLAAIGLEPNNAIVINNYGFSLMMRKKYDEAEDWLLKAKVISGINTRIANNLSILYAKQCRYDDALAIGLETMEEAVVLNNIGYIALLNRDYAAAISFFERAMESSPSYNLTAANNLTRAQKAGDKNTRLTPSAC